MSKTEIPRRIGRYEIRAVVGRGAMGVVYEAVDPTLGRPVAIKTMSFANCPDEGEFRLRFLREARSLGGLQHPNLITVHELFEENGTAFMVMELLEGASLAALIKKRKRLTLSEKLSIVDQIAAGLAEAHAQSIVHRDLKPSNVFVLRSGLVKVLDFGVAKVGEGELTRAGTVFGSVEYMAPEQVRGLNVTQQADVFALGVLAYELLSGRNPFRADTLAASVFKIVSDAPEPLAPEVASLPSDMERVVFRALAKSESERFGSMNELRSAIAAAAEASGLELAPPTLSEQDLVVARERDLGAGSLEPRPSQWSNVAAKADGLEEMYRAGVAAFHDGAYEDAVVALSQVLDEVPMHAMSLHYLASSEEKLRQRRLGVEAHREAAELLARMRDQHRRGDSEQVVQTANELLTIDRDSLEARWYRRNAEARKRASTAGVRSGDAGGSPSLAGSTRPGRASSFGYFPGSEGASKGESPRAGTIVLSPVEARAASSSSPRGPWLLGGVGVVFVSLVAMWLSSFHGGGPAASPPSEPAALPGVRTSPFDGMDEDGTVVLQLPANAPDVAFDRVIPTSIPRGRAVTVGLFGRGFTQETAVGVSDNARILGVRLESEELIEVELESVGSGDTIEIVVAEGRWERRAKLRVEPR